MEGAAVILAGGRSNRMGADKPLVMLAGRPLIAHAIGRLSRQVARLAINANGDEARFARFSLPVIADGGRGFAGPLAGILAAMNWAKTLGGLGAVMTVSADTPFLPLDLAEQLKATDKTGKSIVLAASAGRRHFVCGLWPLTLASDLRHWLEAQEDRSVGAWLQRQNTRQVDFVGDPDPFFNINDASDLGLAESLLLTLASSSAPFSAPP